MALLEQWPTSAGGILDAGVQLWRRSGLHITRVAGPPILLAALVEGLLAAVMPSSNLRDAIVIGASILLYAMSEGLAFVAAGQALGLIPATKGPWLLMRSKLVRVLAGYVMKWTVLLPSLFLLIPALWILQRWFAVPALYLTEDTTLFAAFSRSMQLSRGRRRLLLPTVALVEMVWIFGTLVLYAVIVPEAFNAEYSLRETILGSVISLVFLPLRAGVTLLVYGTLRIAAEAYDLELALASSTNVPSPSPTA